VGCGQHSDDAVTLVGRSWMGTVASESVSGGDPRVYTRHPCLKTRAGAFPSTKQ
jgi:hypothetical protein